MSIITYMTEKAKAAAERHTRLKELNALLIKIEEEQSLALCSRLKDRRFFKKTMGDYRIFFSHHVFQDGQELLCIFDLLHRGSNACEERYQEIRFNPDKLYSKINNENSAKFAQRLAEFKTHPKPQLPPEPNEQESIWLKNYGGQFSQKVIVLETKAWMKAQAKKRFQHSWNSIHSLLQQDVYKTIDIFINNGDFQSHQTTPYLGKSYIDGNNFRLYLQYFPDHQILFLLNLTEKNIEPHQVEPTLNLDVQREILIQNARRAYPLDVFLLDAEEFAQIESQQEGNFALSPEESEILERVYEADKKQNCFPLFINGRAGSGKSTILQYLLKDYLYLSIEHWDSNIAYTPLYLTYSSKLLEAAKTHIDRLLTVNAEVRLQQDRHWQHCYTAHKDEIFSRTFKLFFDFMLELLPEESRHNFIPEHRIGYTKFKQLWAKAADRRADFQRKYSVDLVWHVIRTYIKGMATGVDTYFTPNDYQALSRKHKTVSNEDFNQIYKQVWECWYSPLCKENKYWDDQDLALTILAEVSFPRTYPAVFCDEAQDFTAIELKIIYNFSLFSERYIPAHQIGSIPLIFAGDPLQTLNPTGFRWEAVKSSFHDYLLAPIERRASVRNQTKTINYQELLANYRSIRTIVNFCNYIQLIRICLFSDRYSIQPQKAWFPDEQHTNSLSPFLYSINTPEAEELLKKNALIIIPDCHEDEESEYVDKDPLLKRVVERDEAGVTNIVFSPNMAKGLEYDEVVVLYRFGATCPPTLLERLQGHGDKEPGAAITIEWEYFFNRLYVAASRARQRLVILDEPEAFQNFWGFMQDMDAESMVKHLDADVDPQNWDNKIQVPKEGRPADLESLFEGRLIADDTADLAEKFYQEGLELENPSLLRKARMQYQRLEQNAKAKECYAHALRFEGKYRRAAEAYLDIDDYEFALDCLWTAAAFSEVIKVNWANDIQNDLRIELASRLQTTRNSFTNWKGNLVNTKQALKRLNTALSDGKTLRDNKGWSRSITAILDWLYKYNEDLTDLTPDWKILESLAERFDYAKERLATIAYKLQKFQEARNLWEDTGKTGIKNYYYCVYKTSNWPDTLRPLKQMSKFEQIIADWQSQGEATDNLEESHAAIIVEALINGNHLQQATKLLSELIKTPKILKLLTEQLWKTRKLLLSQSPVDATTAFSLYLDALVETRKWDNIKAVLQETDKLLSKYDNHIHKIEQKLVKQLAYSEALRNAPGNQLNIISQLLRNRFWKKDDRWLPIIERKISIAEIGAAIERANRIDDAIDFYYWAVRLPRLRPPEYRYFDTRIAACMQKKADRLRHQGKSAEEEERKLQELKRKLKLDLVDIEPDPEQYPGSSILPLWLIEAVKEKQKPISQAENEAKQQLYSCDPETDYLAWKNAVRDYTKKLAEHDKWYTISQDWCRVESLERRFPSLSFEQLEETLDTVLVAIIEPLSVADAVVGCSNNIYKPLNSLISILKDDNLKNTWTACTRLEIDHDIAGAAIERIGRHIDAIHFYKWALEQESTRRGKKAIAERLIVVHKRYATYLQNEKDSKEVEHLVEIHKREAKKLREQYRLLEVELPKYPELYF